MSVGLLAPPWATVPPPAYGGTELMVSELARGLVAAGHDVVLYATGNSTAPVRILYSLNTGDLDRIGAGVVELPHVMQGYEALAGCDVVHDHTLPSGHHTVSAHSSLTAKQPASPWHNMRRA